MTAKNDVTNTLERIYKKQDYSKNDESSYKNNERTIWENTCELLLYPLARFIEITKIRFDAHIYVEVKLPFLHCSVKFCITTVWIILFMIYSKM